MVRTTKKRSMHRLLAGLSVGAVLAAGTTTLVFLLTGSPASALAETSSAYGVSASGVDPKGPQPSVSSDGAVKSASGSVSGMGWSATGITVKAGAGLAEATVGSVTVANRSIGSVSAKCANGKTSYSHSGSAPSDPKLRVSFGGGAGATIQILGAGDKPAETITVAVVKCGQGAPPTAPPTTQPTTKPTGEPTSKPTGKPTQRPTTTRRPGGTSDEPAPEPPPKNGHHPVTG